MRRSVQMCTKGIIQGILYNFECTNCKRNFQLEVSRHMIFICYLTEKLKTWNLIRESLNMSFKRISVANSIFRKTIFFRYLSCYSLLVDYSWLHATAHVIARGKPRWGRRWPHMKQFAYDQTCVDKMCTAFPYFLTYYYLPIDLKKHQYSQNFF